MKIGIDFDNTMVDTFGAEKYYLDKYFGGSHLYAPSKIPADVEKQLIDNYHTQITLNAKFKEGVKECFDYLKSCGYTLCLVTARGAVNPPIIEVTKNYLEENGFCFDEYYFGNMTKGKCLKDNNINFLIDDNDSVLEETSKHGIVVKYGKSDKYLSLPKWDIELVKEVIENVKKRRNDS